MVCVSRCVSEKKCSDSFRISVKAIEITSIPANLVRGREKKRHENACFTWFLETVSFFYLLTSQKMSKKVVGLDKLTPPLFTALFLGIMGL